MSKKNRRLKFKQQMEKLASDKEAREAEKAKAQAFEFMQKINYILQRTRVTSVGIMETKKPDDGKTRKAIGKVLFPNEGGILVFIEGESHPAKGFCYGETVEIVDEVKKTGMGFLRGLFGGLGHNKVKMVLFVLLFRRQFMSIAVEILSELNYRMTRVLQKPHRYCTCGREIYRVFNLMVIWYPDWKDILGWIRNIFCMFLEYDDAYRYPFQDVMAFFDRAAARKDIVKELRRVLALMIGWDHRGTAEKFERIRKVLFLLNFNKNLKEAVKRFFLELDLDELKLDEDDKHHAQFKWGYNWQHAKDYNPDYHEILYDKVKEKEKEKKEIQK